MAEMLKKIIAANRAGSLVAVPSVCSAHPVVLEASLRLAEDLDRVLVVEATSNQVNQDGGYTGMKPADFIGFVHGLADAAGVQRSRILFGGDHLGPQAWRNGTAVAAMAKAHQMVADYAAAGFRKIHLDCSEGCSGEAAQLGDKVAAARAADLAVTALRAAPDPDAVMFVIGTEVPPPGGARADENGDVRPTTPESAGATLEAHEAAFRAAGLGHAMGQIGGLVVQPGVEFSPMQVHHLPLARDPGFLAVLKDWPGLCLEAHSTDYQRPAAFVRLAELGFAFQKVGPALTFAWREALYALDALRMDAGWAVGPSLVEEMEAVMLATPEYWQGHYRGDSCDLRVERHFGLADRVRYYWPQERAQAAVTRLLGDLTGKTLPDPLLTQFFAAEEVDAARTLGGDLPKALAIVHVQSALRPYFFDAHKGQAG